MEKADEGQRERREERIGVGGETLKTPSLDGQWWAGAWPLATLVCLQV